VQDLLSRADRFREQAMELSELAKLATSYVVYDRYQKVAQQYRLLAEGELRLAEAKGISYRGTSARPR
jgi:hypothetical protein